MFSQMPAQIFALPVLRNAACALLGAVLAVTTASSAASAQVVTQSSDLSNRAIKAIKTDANFRPAPVVAATASKRTTDWLVPGILAGSVMVGGVGAVLIMRRSTQSFVTEPPEPLLYSPDSAPTTTPEARPDAKTSESKVQQPEQLQQLEPTTIAHATTRMPKVSIMDVLVHDLRSKDSDKRQKAIWELGRRGDSRAVQPLVDLLVDSDSRQRSLVLSALSEISTRTLKPMSRALALSMQDENADVRKNAIRDLTRIYDTLTNISQLLHSACEDSDPEVQETAKWAIGQINRIKSPMIQGAGRSVSLPESLN